MNPLAKNYSEKSREAFGKSLHMIPIKTGNLRYNALKYDEVNNHAEIYINLKIAPYGDYINRPGYKTQGYWERFLDEYLKNYIKLTKARRKK